MRLEFKHVDGSCRYVYKFKASEGMPSIMIGTRVTCPLTPSVLYLRKPGLFV